ncbi:MAG: haloacid dehalogenase type II, partial [Armatimonadetes bacterium]|nr:haloacid dehalogenase type II [Anaerolineae bacterium]
MSRVIVFDVNETLLDLAALDPLFDELFGEPGVRGQWFTQFISNALTTTVTGVYHPFGEIGMGALHMVAARRGRTLTPDERGRVASALTQLPP